MDTKKTCVQERLGVHAQKPLWAQWSNMGPIQPLVEDTKNKSLWE